MKPTSLDELISRKAEEFADQVRATAKLADKEEEIRIEVASQLKSIQKDAGITLDTKHEFTVASGRVDSVYNRVIIEYKNPSSPSARIGPSANSPGAKKVVEQIKSRFYDMRSKDTLNTLFGVGCDGNHFIFVRYYHDKWHVEDPVEVTKHSAERFLTVLFTFGRGAKRFEPDYLAGDFGSGEGSVASAGIKVLYDAISVTTNPKAQTFFSQWKILFGEVCGYDVENPSDKIKKLAESYGVPTNDVKPAEMLFSVHSYYALFMKLLAGEIMGHFHSHPSLVQKLNNAPSSNKLRDVLQDLEQGGIFRQLNITNFLEGDLFAWYLPAWSEPIADLVRKISSRLADYNPMTLKEKPAEARDLLKKLYQQLFPKSVRHDLGEYYTPDWLAEHVLNELGYVGDPDKRILDPACGSGTFLVMAITRIRSWYEKNREKLHYNEGELCRKILANVVGFDLNPLAVMAARTNYLIAIRDLVSHVEKVEIPVYLCDSILTPSTYGGLFAGSTTAAKELKTSAARFLVPTEIATNADDVAKYAEQLEFCVRNGYAPKEFVQRCQDEGLPITAESLHIDLYNELVALDKANKNGVWARIIKNAFAPLFIGTVDYVAGNPPWVNWSNLPEGYRTETGPLWQKYRLFPHKGLRARTGSAMDDISVLMTYVSADSYLKERGRLGFVITQSVFKTEGGGEGFRRLALPDGEGLGIARVCDMSSFQPFDGAANRTATFTMRRGEPTRFPVRYDIWKANEPFDSDTTIEDVQQRVTVHPRQALPISPDKATSPWIVGTPEELTGAAKCFGASDYQGRYGTHCHASGIYWVEVLKQAASGKVLIRNLGDVGKNKYPSREHCVDEKFLFPLARGRDINRWSVSTRCSMVLAQQSDDQAKAISESVLKRQAPETFAFFKLFEEALRKRSGYKKFFRSGVDPFYSVYNVGPYTFAPHKVLWREVAQDLRAAVSSGEPILVPDHTLVSIATESEEEAHYVCAMLNSTPANYIVTNYVALHPAPHILKYIRIPRFKRSDANHKRLASLSRRCHEAVLAEKPDEVGKLERDVDRVVGLVWGLDGEELNAMRGIALRASSDSPSADGADD